jgi:hypothetical protein
VVFQDVNYELKMQNAAGRRTRGAKGWNGVHFSHCREAVSDLPVHGSRNLWARRVTRNTVADTGDQVAALS